MTKSIINYDDQLLTLIPDSFQSTTGLVLAWRASSQELDSPKWPAIWCDYITGHWHISLIMLPFLEIQGGLHLPWIYSHFSFYCSMRITAGYNLHLNFLRSSVWIFINFVISFHGSHEWIWLSWHEAIGDMYTQFV